MDFDLENTATLYINGEPVSELFVDGNLVWKGQWSPYSNQYLIDENQASPDASLIAKGSTSETPIMNKMFTNPLNRDVNVNDLIFTGEIGASDTIQLIPSGLILQRGNGGWGRFVSIKVGNKIVRQWRTDSPYVDISTNGSFYYTRRVSSPIIIEFPAE